MVDSPRTGSISFWNVHCPSTRTASASTSTVLTAIAASRRQHRTVLRRQLLWCGPTTVHRRRVFWGDRATAGSLAPAGAAFYGIPCAMRMHLVIWSRGNLMHLSGHLVMGSLSSPMVWSYHTPSRPTDGLALGSKKLFYWVWAPPACYGDGALLDRQ
eukprot:SAG25_NODE_21_length_22373_cov_13.904373_3_plen_157_part_00